LILIALSFPPLFGHEIIAILCGVVWGLWVGFGIVAAGTFFGEIGTYFVFKTVLRKRAQKLERTNLNYGSLARITRDGGFLIVFIIRLSVIPSHFTTAVFSTCGVKFWIFLVATLLTLPKQLVTVYVGVIISSKTKGKTVSDIVLGVTFIITVVAAVYIGIKMKRIRSVLLREQRERKDAKTALLRNDSPQYTGHDIRDHSFDQAELPGQSSYSPPRNQGYGSSAQEYSSQIPNAYANAPQRTNQNFSQIPVRRPVSQSPPRRVNPEDKFTSAAPVPERSPARQQSGPRPGKEEEAFYTPPAEAPGSYPLPPYPQSNNNGPGAGGRNSSPARRMQPEPYVSRTQPDPYNSRPPPQLQQQNPWQQSGPPRRQESAGPAPQELDITASSRTQTPAGYVAYQPSSKP
jgi:uncharacterized membrane protein YdjX (TVP38/TMEM64 family)